MFKIYLSRPAYQKIISSVENKAATEHSHLYRLLKQQPVQILTPSDVEKYKTHPENVLKNPSSLYILDITPSEASNIQESYGIMCLSTGHLDVSPLIDVNDIHTADEGKKLGRGWDSVLDSVEKLPSNALLLTDRYLFSQRNKNIGDGLSNVKSILTELLPQRFEGGDYHVTIVFCNDKKHGTYSFNEIASKLNNIAQQMECHYPIMMEVFGISKGSKIYDKLHSRRIVSNYFLVEVTHKLAAFNRNLGTTQQTLIPLALFTKSSLNGVSTSPLDSINQTINNFHDFYNHILSQKDEDIDYLYAFNGRVRERCMGIRNRLFK